MAGPDNVIYLADRVRPRASRAETPAGGFRVRLHLEGSVPQVWRRLDLPADLPLPRLHDAIQAAMGWTNSHLHRFRTGADRWSSHLLTRFDVEEDEDGVLEDDVRLDQLLASVGDALWYEYDFGDDWDHVLELEEVLAERPAEVRCLAGELACPPEDCGGIGGHEELAAWVRSGYDDALLPDGFEDAEHAHGWLPAGWHPDRFDVDEANAELSTWLAEPVAVSGELADLFDDFEHREIRTLRQILGRPASHGSAEVADADAARLTAAYRILLEVVGDGLQLTAAGYLPPKVVEVLAERTDIASWWIGKANREDQTWPVAELRSSARALGLVTVRKGRLAPTAAGVRCRHDPPALWRHIVGRLPVGTKEFDRHAGWMTLAVVGSGAPPENWRSEIADLLSLLGWRSGDRYSAPSANNPTLELLELLAVVTSRGRRPKVDPAVVASVAATARAAIRRS
ncbi:hypothetical protein JCM18899A_08030 [Nocardioides sp. AN3]